jgi:hypothetical protein
MRGIVRWAMCGLLLPATQVVWAQTVIRMAPPAPVQVGCQPTLAPATPLVVVV